MASVIYLICQKQIEARSLTPDDFAELLPQPPDSILEAIKEAIVNFYPSGRASHVREVLTKFDEIAEAADKLMLAKLTQMQPTMLAKMKVKSDDPKLMSMFDKAADDEWDEAMRKVFPTLSEPGT